MDPGRDGGSRKSRKRGNRKEEMLWTQVGMGEVEKEEIGRKKEILWTQAGGRRKYKK